jgi:hypothetical protein
MEEIQEEDLEMVTPAIDDKLESQSDIVIGQHLRDGDSLMYDEEDERKTNSDIHEMFFVFELLKDDDKFEKLLQRPNFKALKIELNESNN